MKLFRKIIVFLILVAFGAGIASAQTADDRAEGTKYWFNVKLTNSVNKITHAKEYSLRLVSSTIYNGGIKLYQKQLWQGTTNASRICVGPFSSWEEANDAVKLYKMVNDTVTERAKSNNCYWFLLKVKYMERSHSYSFERMAARVASGSFSDFSSVLRESLTFKTLAIGPFKDPLDAELSKQIYRIEE